MSTEEEQASNAEQIRLFFEEMADHMIDAALKIVDAKENQAKTMSTRSFLHSQHRCTKEPKE